MYYSSMNYLYIKAKLDLIVKINVYIINENDSLKLHHHLVRVYLPYPRETRKQSNKVTK